MRESTNLRAATLDELLRSTSLYIPKYARRAFCRRRFSAVLKLPDCEKVIPNYSNI